MTSCAWRVSDATRCVARVALSVDAGFNIRLLLGTRSSNFNISVDGNWTLIPTLGRVLDKCQRRRSPEKGRLDARHRYDVARSRAHYIANTNFVGSNNIPIFGHCFHTNSETLNTRSCLVQRPRGAGGSTRTHLRQRCTPRNCHYGCIRGPKAKTSILVNLLSVTLRATAERSSAQSRDATTIFLLAGGANAITSKAQKEGQRAEIFTPPRKILDR
jgi:hypothetical protein